MSFPMTPGGLAQLKKELIHLTQIERPAIVEEIARASSYGDLSENAEYHAAKEKQNQIERRIRELETRITNAQVIDVASLSGPSICFGATVTLYDEDAGKEVIYQIVGADEANVKEGKISVDSLLARALIGKEVGMSFEFSTPRAERSFTIRCVRYVASS